MERNGFTPLLGQTQIQAGMQKHCISKRFEIDIKTKRRHHSEHHSKHGSHQRKATEKSFEKCDNPPPLHGPEKQDSKQYLSVNYPCVNSHQCANVRRMSLRKRLSKHETQRTHATTESPVLGKRRTSSVPDEYGTFLLSSGHVVNEDCSFLSPHNRWLLPSQSSYR